MGLKEGENEREKLLFDLEKKGLTVKTLRYCVFKINDHKVNIKYNGNINPYSRYWFHVTPNYLGIMDFFIFICGDSEDYYVIPCKDMNEFVSRPGHSIDKIYGYPNFTLDLKMHRYLPGNGEKLDISYYYKNYSLLQ